MSKTIAFNILSCERIEQPPVHAYETTLQCAFLYIKRYKIHTLRITTTFRPYYLTLVCITMFFTAALAQQAVSDPARHRAQL